MEYPSLSYFAKTVMDFDNEIIEVLEKEIIKDTDNHFGKLSFLKKLLDGITSYKRKYHTLSNQSSNLIIKLGTSISIMGEKPAVRDEILGEVRSLASKYKSKEQNKVEQSKSVQKLLEEQIDIGEALILAYVINKDEKLKFSYIRLLNFYKNMNGATQSENDLSVLFNLIPDVIDEKSADYLKEISGNISIFPKENENLSKSSLDAKQILSEFNLGKLTFRPSKDSGWLNYRNYAFQSLISNSSTQSPNLSNEDRLTMKMVFMGAMNKNLEFQQMDNFIVSKFYERLASSYSFLLDMINEISPESRSLKRLNKEKHLVTEMKELIRLCYGLYLIGKQDEELLVKKEKKDNKFNMNDYVINSLKNQYDIQKGSFTSLCESNEERCLQMINDWENYLP